MESKEKIVCTEPRRMAAKVLAVRVAEDMNIELGQLVDDQVQNCGKLYLSNMETKHRAFLQEAGGDFGK